MENPLDPATLLLYKVVATLGALYRYWRQDQTGGARIQGRLPDVLIRRVVGVLVVTIGAWYLWSGLA